MFCLEPLKQNEQVINPIGCQCDFKSHGPCLQLWFEQKQQYECPICHTVCVSNPVQQAQHVIVYVNREQPRISENQITHAQQKCIGMCCLILIGWALSMTILDFVLKK
jgi:hypothetical protein